MAAHFLAAGPPPTEPFGGQTWLDFLRETSADDAAGPYPSFLDGGGGGQMLPPPRAGEGGRGSSGGGSGSGGVGGVGAGLLQPEAPGVAERKRRLTAPEPPTRRPGYAGSGSGGSGASFQPLSAASGSSAATAIDLTALPAAQPHRGGGRAGQADAGRRESDIVLPAWQPDSEVVQCPVCGNQFSFWYRKHHCRYVLGEFFLLCLRGLGWVGGGWEVAFLLFITVEAFDISRRVCFARNFSWCCAERKCINFFTLALYFLRDHDANHLPLENVGEWFVRIVRHIGSRFPASSLFTLRLNWLELGRPLSTLLVTMKTKQ